MKMLKHEHIIRFYGDRKVDTINYLFLEYADGGELFDRIGKCSHDSHRRRTVTSSILNLEPDLGMEPGLAQHFFKQLLDGVVCQSFSLPVKGLCMCVCTVGVLAPEGRGPQRH